MRRMEFNMKIHEMIENVNSKEDFIDFINALSDDNL